MRALAFLAFAAALAFAVFAAFNLIRWVSGENEWPTGIVGSALLAVLCFQGGRAALRREP